MNVYRLPVFFILLLLLWLPLAGVFGQSNTMVDEILSQESLLIGHGAYIVLVSQGLLADEASPQEAVQALTNYPSLKRFAESRPTETMSVGEFSFLLQELLSIPKGMFSSVFPGPRYAVRDLRFMGIIQSRATAGMELSGERALRILNRALSERERRL